MNWIHRRIKILFDSRLKRNELHKIDIRIIAAFKEVRNNPEQLKLIRKLVELMETK